jgi:hypothetical protein
VYVLLIDYICEKHIDDAGIDIYKKDLLFCRFRLFASRMH